MTFEPILKEQLSKSFGPVADLRLQRVGGGGINETYRLSYAEQMLFCKINSATKFPHLFSSESQGLAILARQNRIKTPRVIDCFEAGSHQFLLLEWIEEGERTEGFWKTFGEQLAALHRISQPLCGLETANYIGSVPQSNQQHQRWTDFFSAERLQPMVERCAAKRLLHSRHVAQFEAVTEKLAGIFEEEPPSLLHGDLWSGNFLCNQTAEPVLIDPAVYFGHRSVDLAMTTLFGGFRQPFYEAYHYHFPLPKNYEAQWAVCNLYPLLIHLYLFGSGYLSQIERTLTKFA